MELSWKISGGMKWFSSQDKKWKWFRKFLRIWKEVAVETRNELVLENFWGIEMKLGPRQEMNLFQKIYDEESKWVCGQERKWNCFGKFLRKWNEFGAMTRNEFVSENLWWRIEMSLRPREKMKLSWKISEEMKWIWGQDKKWICFRKFMMKNGNEFAAKREMKLCYKICEGLRFWLGIICKSRERKKKGSLDWEYFCPKEWKRREVGFGLICPRE